MRWLPLLALLLVGLIAVPFAASVRTGAGNRQWIDPASQTAQALAAVEGAFGRQDGMVIGLFADDVLAEPLLAWQRQAVEEVATFPGIVAVDSVVNAQDVEVDELGPAAVPLLSRSRELILAHPLYRGLLVAADGRAAALVVRLAASDDAATVALEEQLQRWLAQHPPPAGSVVLGGLPVQQQALNRAVAADQALTVPVMIGVLAVLLLLILRDWRPAAVVLLATGSALVWTFAILGLAGREIEALLGLLPPLVLGIGTATGLHLSWALGAPAAAGGRYPQRQVLAQTIAPLGLATLTTMVGVGGLWWGAVPAIMHFAPWAVLGVALAALFPALWVTAAVSIIPTAGWQARERGIFGAAYADWLAQVARLCARRRGTVLGCAGVLLVVAGLLCTRLRPDADFVHALPVGDRAREAHAQIDARLTGVLSLDLLVDLGRPIVAADLEVMRTVARAARQEPSITACLSLADIDALVVARGDARPASERLADLTLGANPVVARFLSGTVLRLHARQRDGSVAEAAAAARRLQEVAQQAAPQATITIASGALLLDETTAKLVPSIVKSLVASLLMNGVLLLIFLRQLRLAAIGLLLSAVPLVVTYAAVPLFGWSLDVGISMIACVALGIIMDDAIHMTYALHREADTAAAMRTIGPVLTAAAIALAAAFSVCALGGFSYTRRFGELLAIAFLSGLVVNLLLAPALMRRSSGPTPQPEPGPL